jgi:hypothetical protein
MTQRQDYIWYASYGSNILEERFLYYIKGGQPVGATKIYLGCTDKSMPIDKEEIYINSELYFAKKSKTWDKGGVCFIKTNFDPQVQTLGRMYLITKQQFIDVVRQETENENNLAIDFEKAISDGSITFKDGSWYGNLIYLGTQNDFPIFTFTNQDNISETNKPSENYLRTIIRGIQETYNLSTTEIVDYFISKSGIKNNFSREQLTKIIEGSDK